MRRQILCLVVHILLFIRNITDKKIGLAHSPCNAGKLFAIRNDNSRSLHLLILMPLIKKIECVSDKSARSASLIIQCANNTCIRAHKLVIICKYHFNAKTDYILRSHKVLGILCNLIAITLNQMLIDIGHITVGNCL